ncbi:efflux RND transporter periplasmic adaptor subunit [Sphingosinicella rhizophila]|uniref:Efflux RND transporter periplasmic adaptor subunit n=1 Tax=Sphingosinicella rhizophila TaxID=3050082 RepID=A0ABU3Q663_9SPHN|nr:efflux RND transporter periplasmic adaptor subunit [Sphingosinicella sp. GR2756]MDT9598886.1 efflux RND transporter periplasmic adaptor subunit [Sphingosinicella sp. GR2756]
MKINALAAAVAASILLLAGCSKGESAAPPPPPQVTVANPRVEAVVDWDEYVGRFEAVQSVDVKPRVTGYLRTVAFRDGQYVRAGQTLFTVDARPAQAQLDQARAQLARAQATLVNARTELARSETLAKSQAASKEEVEQRLAAVRAGAADVAAAQAAVRAQQLNVGFTRVTAPISGRISERLVDPGNAVSADETVLTRIVSTDPIHFAFEGSEALLLKYLRQDAGATPGTQVRIRLQDEADYSHAGRLDFVDNEVKTGAGTIRARALVANPDGFLRPGMFGHMRLAGSNPYRAMLVPDTAIVTDAARRIVYIVGKANVVAPRPVDLGPVIGNLRVIRSGISPDDRVIIGGIQRAFPGQKVQPKPGRVPPLAVPEGGSAAPAASAPASTATPVGPASR